MSGIEKGFKLLGSFTDEVFSKTIEMMKIHPLIALLNHNLLTNVGSAVLAEVITSGPNKGKWKFAGFIPGPESVQLDAAYFDTRQQLVQHIFRENAKKSGALLAVDTAGKLFSSFSMDKILALLT